MAGLVITARSGRSSSGTGTLVPEEDTNLGGILSEFKLGDKVEKAKGYKWPGVIVAVFDTLSEKRRYVVECTVPEVAGALHIYSAKDLKKA